jgi:hypothetical protein
MDPVDLAFEYAKKKKIMRLNKNKVRRCEARSKFRSNFHKNNLTDIELSVVF